MNILIYLLLSVRIIHCDGLYIAEHPCARVPQPTACVQVRDITRCR